MRFFATIHTPRNAIQMRFYRKNIYMRCISLL